MIGAALALAVLVATPDPCAGASVACREHRTRAVELFVLEARERQAQLDACKEQLDAHEREQRAIVAPPAPVAERRDVWSYAAAGAVVGAVLAFALAHQL